MKKFLLISAMMMYGDLSAMCVESQNPKTLLQQALLQPRNKLFAVIKTPEVKKAIPETEKVENHTPENFCMSSTITSLTGNNDLFSLELSDIKQASPDITAETTTMSYTNDDSQSVNSEYVAMAADTIIVEEEIVTLPENTRFKPNITPQCYEEEVEIFDMDMSYGEPSFPGYTISEQYTSFYMDKRPYNNDRNFQEEDPYKPKNLNRRKSSLDLYYHSRKNENESEKSKKQLKFTRPRL